MAQNIIKSGDWGSCLWGIDDTGFLVIGEGTGADLGGFNSTPWEEFRKFITAVSVNGTVKMPAGSSLRGMFKDCENLSEVKIGGIDTSEVIDMSSMFENCSSLRFLDLSRFITENVEDMGKMFSGCKNLGNLDLSLFDTSKARNMRGMFNKCNKLHNIVLSPEFNVTGNGRTDCGNLSIRETGRFRIGKVINVKGGVVTYHENRGKDQSFERQTLFDFKYTIEENPFDSASEDCKFFGWCDDPSCNGRIYIPGEELKSIDDDLDLYAVWISPPKIGNVEPMAKIAYGNPLPFVIPEVISENDSSVYGYLEISPDGKADTWQAIERNAILPAACNGWLVRLCATNKCGTSVSNVVPIKIKKAGVDLSKVRWAESENMTYDGSEKSVWLEGLPEGVTAEYSDNTAVLAGRYVTSVSLNYDTDNYDIPVRIKNHEWTIKKAHFDMSESHWNYEDDFEYDGTEKHIELEGLPEGVTATYSGNTGIAAGTMMATASFEYDSDNYEAPEAVKPCTWEIRRKLLNISDIKWSGYEDFMFDGTEKSVRILNLPEDAAVEYMGNAENLAGRYLARATVIGNYYTNMPIEFEWEIKKARFDMSDVKWTYTEPFTYNRELHEVELTGVPAGLTVKYHDNIGTDAGDYEARATFVCNDSHNYATPADFTLTWSIKKAVADGSSMRWDYEGAFDFDGGTKSVELLGLPEGIYAVIENGSATNAGIYIAHAVLKYDDRNYEIEQPADCQWQINKTRFDMSGVYWQYFDPFTYDGEPKAVTLDGIPEGLDVEYQNNIKIDAGKYVATAKFTPLDATNYETPEINACTWSINKAVLDKGELVWTDDSEMTYDGQVKTVKIISDISDKIRVEYTGNSDVSAGEHEAVAHFYPVDEDNYEAPTSVHHSWFIKKGDFEMHDLTWDYTEAFVYDGNKKQVALNSVPEGAVVHYENNVATEVGEYTATARFEITNAENYNTVMPVYIRWSISKAEYDMSNVRWQEETSFSYDGTEKMVVLTGLPEGVTPVYTNNSFTECGEYVASVEFEYDEHNYYKPEVEPCAWHIEKSVFDISSAKWDYTEDFVYDGTEKIVRVIDMPDGARLEYDNAAATNAGIYYASAEVIAEDEKNYNNCTMQTLAWKIAKSDYDMSAVYWDYDKPMRYDGTTKKVVLKGLPEGVIPTYYGNEGSEAGGYTASVSFTVADPANYNIPTFENCTWEIAKADVDMTGVEWSYTSELTYTGRMHEIVLKGLPEGVRAIYSGNCATAAGIYIAEAELVMYDNVNYNAPTVDKCRWEIVKADYDMSLVHWAYSDAKVYNGRNQSIYLENLPNGITASYTENEATDIGSYTAIANLTVLDPYNYNTPTVSQCDWEIIPADIDMSAVRWNFVPESFIYDGRKKKVELTNLPENVKVKYSGNTATGAGTYSAVALFSVTSDNFNTPDSMTIDWFIGKADCKMGRARWDYTGEFIYDGQPHGIELTGLPENVSVKYENNRTTEAGVYTAVAKFSTDADNFNIPEDMTCVWVINKANCDISDIRWDYDQAFTYDGTVKTVSLAGLPKTLTATYRDNSAVNAGSYRAYVEFENVDPNNYIVPGGMEIEWEISKADYDMSKVNWTANKTFEYDGSIKSVELSGYPEGLTPIYTDAQATESGRYEATAVFSYDTQNYNEPTVGSCKWMIKKSDYDMSNTYWSYEEAFTYNGKEQSVYLLGLPEGLRPIYSDNAQTDAGEYHAKVVFDYDEDNYRKPRFEGCKWRIDLAEVPVDESKLRWDYNEAYEYDGTAKTLTLATYRDEVVEPTTFFSKLFGKKRAATDDSAHIHICGVPDGFEAIYEENEYTEVGSHFAKAILRHKDNPNYKDYIVPGCKWEIKKAKVDLSQVRWDYDRPLVYDGEEKVITLKNVPEILKVIYADNTATEAGVYEAKASFELLDEENYLLPKPVRGCLWTIAKAHYDMSEARWTYDDDIYYNGKEKTVKVVGLPEGVKVESYQGNKATEAGAYTATVTLKYKNSANYEAPVMQPLRWQIHKQPISTDDIEWNYNSSTLFVYDGDVKEIKLIGVPEDVDVSYVDNSKINAGQYVAKARLVYDTKNYTAKDVPDCHWTINKADLDTSNIAWDYTEAFTYDGEAKKVSLINVPKGFTIRYIDNIATEIGAYTAKAYLSYNTDNYNSPIVETNLEWEIVRKDQ